MSEYESTSGVIGTFNQEKAFVGAFSVLVKTDCETDGALHSTNGYAAMCNVGMKM